MGKDSRSVTESEGNRRDDRVQDVLGGQRARVGWKRSALTGAGWARGGGAGETS